MSKKLLIALASLVIAAFALAACGDDDESTTSAAEETTSSAEGSSGGGGTIDVAAAEDGSLAFTETELTASAGPNTIEFDNPSDVPHNVYVEDDSGEVVAETETVTGDATSASADLDAGSYVFYCDVPGHREGGMEGTLEVK